MRISRPLLAGLLWVAAPAVLAHTRLQTPEVNENSRHYNAAVIGHGCNHDGHNHAVGGTSIVFPDGVDSLVSDITDTANPKSLTQPVSSFISNYGNVLSAVVSREVFDATYVKTASGSSNIIGLWAGGGPGVPASGFLGLVPMRVNALVIEPTSCARSVTLVVAIADVCENTSLAGFDSGTVNLWTPAVGSNFDGATSADGYNSPATLKIKRTSSLPAECGAGIDVKITPSAAQLNRDMPAVDNDGNQIWPLP